jgi:hypothetical protein
VEYTSIVTGILVLVSTLRTLADGLRSNADIVPAMWPTYMALPDSLALIIWKVSSI